MKKVVLLFSFLFVSCFVSTASFAQTTTATKDTNSVAAKSSQIMNLLTTKLGLTSAQVTKVQPLVTDFANKFQKSNPKSTDSGLKAKVEKDAQSGLVKEFSTELPKVLDSSQSTKYAGIQDKVATLFSQIR
ncbi:MAG TPA: hypothetical protein VK750_00205 [Cytophagaceae bacterium]|jgi:hypothetical protein|nr:hypothetical protein [Cytophagaceae bacterium]